MISFKLSLLIISSILDPIISYTIYRIAEPDRCYIYENPAFPVLTSNKIVRNRFTDNPDEKPVIFVNNRIPKQRLIYPNSIVENPNDHQIINGDKPSVVYYLNQTPNSDVDTEQCDQSQQNHQLPNIYYDTTREIVENDEPPIDDDMVSVEKSELTEEAHDLEDVEIEETCKDDPANEPKEIILETVTYLPEQSTDNAAITMLKKKLDSKKASIDDVEVKKKLEIAKKVEKQQENYGTTITTMQDLNLGYVKTEETTIPVSAQLDSQKGTTEAPESVLL